jgi:YVTN family beta-propeller protein
MMRVLIALAMLVALGCGARGEAPTSDGSIPLADTRGRIDHLAVDLGRKRLFVAELGNGTVDVVDLATRKVIKRIYGLKEPQGIAYLAKADLVAVASGGDGTLRLYVGSDFAVRGVVKLGEDADNVRLDERNGNLVIGYGNGALAVVDPVKAQKIKTIDLPGHPESFRLDGARVFVNVPDAGQIVIADLESGKVTGKWTPEKLSSNFPMILDDADHVAVVFRSPAKLVLYDKANGKSVAAAQTCGDSDDVFFDTSRSRFYVSCGSGAVDVFARDLHALGRVSTSLGARTSLFVPELDRLFVAARAGILGSNASLAVFKPGGKQ